MLIFLRSSTLLIPPVKVKHCHLSHLNKLCPADPEHHSRGTVDITIGADHYCSIIKPKIIRGDLTSTIAQLLIFEWIVLGFISVTGSSLASIQLWFEKDDAIQDLLTKFWVHKEVFSTTHTTLTPEEGEC